MAETIKQLTFNESTYPDVIDVVSRLSELEERKPHDTARRLIIEAGQQRIKELSNPCDLANSSMPEKESNIKDNLSQEKKHNNSVNQGAE